MPSQIRPAAEFLYWLRDQPYQHVERCCCESSRSEYDARCITAAMSFRRRLDEATNDLKPADLMDPERVVEIKTDSQPESDYHANVPR